MLSTPSSSSDRIPELDGIRGLAILLVLMCHANRFYPAFLQARGIYQFGWIGVNLFFVLSGYLITGILLRTRDSMNFYKRFYLRRTGRILPLYFASLAACFTLSRVARLHNVHWWAYLLMLQNLLPLTSASSLFTPAWSLAIEEQYYAAWPWIVRHFNRHKIAVVCCVILVASPLARYVVPTIGIDYWSVCFQTQYNLDGIAFGSLLALIPIAVRKRLALALVITGFIGMWAVELVPVISPLFPTFLCGLFGGLVCSPPAVFRSSVLRWLGVHSYGLYLLHYAVFAWYSAAHLPFLFTLLVTLGLAFVSWNYFELPILNRFRAKAESLNRAAENQYAPSIEFGGAFSATRCHE